MSDGAKREEFQYTLEAVPNRYSDRDYAVDISIPEFTCVCPRTGLPDFARLVIRYIPGRRLVELKSLKYYLTSYRNIGILQEHAVNRVLEDLVALLQPVSMSVEAEYKERGGMKTKAAASHSKDTGKEVADESQQG